MSLVIGVTEDVEDKWAVAEAGVERLPSVAGPGVCSVATALRGRGTTLVPAPAVLLWLAPESAGAVRAAAIVGL